MEINSWIHMQPALNPQSVVKQPQTPPETHPVRGEANSGEKWQTTRTKTNMMKMGLLQTHEREKKETVISPQN